MSERERDRVVVEHLPLVRAIAVAIRKNLPAAVELDDLIQSGTIGLFQAFDRFDPAKQTTFGTFAKYRIRGAILDSLRQLDWASRDLRRLQKQAEAATYELSVELERAPAESEIAQKLGVDIERLRRMMLKLRSTISASSRSAKHDDLPAPEFSDKPEAQPDNVCMRKEMRVKLRSALSVLTPRYQRVIELYYGRDLSMKEIGVLLGVNESRVSRMHAAALRKMRLALAEGGIESARAAGAAA